MIKSIIPFMYIVFYSTLLIVCLSGCTSKSKELYDNKSRLEQEIRSQVKILNETESLSSITEKMVEYKIPAISLAIINRGELSWTEVYQNKDFHQQQYNNTSIFQAASLSKPVTFLAALRMHAAGKLNLDNNIQDYLKEFILPKGKQTNGNPVTFRNIFSHTSGINPGGYQGYDRNVVMPSDLDILRGSAGVNSTAIEVVTAPNELLAYSGGGYTLAELALQDLFNDEFANIMKKWILEPAEMNNSMFTQPLHESDTINAVKGHTYSGALVNGGWHNHPEQAAAGLWSNSADMAKFLIEIYKAYHGDNSIFLESDIKSILSHERDNHVYGFIINRSGDDISLTHYGGNIGYRTGMTISLTSGNGLVYFINSDNGGVLGNELLISASQIYKWQHFNQTEVIRKKINSEVLDKLSGQYRWNNQVNLSIKYDEIKNQISLIFPNGDEYLLVPIADGELNFIHVTTGVQLSFKMNDNPISFEIYGQPAIKL